MTRPAAGSTQTSVQDAQSRAKFEQLYAEHFAAIYAFVLRRRPSQEVGDLVSEVFAVAWRRIRDVPPNPDAKLWLYGVARRVLSQDERARVRRRSLLDRLSQGRPAAPEHLELEDPRAERLRGLLEHLRPRDQEIVRLIAWERLSHAEVGELLGCSTNTIAVRWHRAVERLRKAMPLTSVQGSEERPIALREEVNDGD